MSEPAAVSSPAPQLYYCPACGRVYPQPGVCQAQHELTSLLPKPTESPAPEAAAEPAETATVETAASEAETAPEAAGETPEATSGPAAEPEARRLNPDETPSGIGAGWVPPEKLQAVVGALRAAADAIGDLLTHL